MVARQIPFYDYPASFAADGAELVRIFSEVAGRGAFILQAEVKEFEAQLQALIGVKHAIGVGNCTDGLILALRASGVSQGDEVIFCTHTFVATASAIHHVGAIPVPVDCGADHLMDVTKIEGAITPRTKAIVPTQLNGRVCEMDSILTLAARHGLTIVEDAAQALGATYRGKAAGTFGALGAFSFYPAKNLGALGDAGAVVTNDDALAERVRLLRDHGRHSSGEVVMWGLNSRLDNIQAAFLSHRLRRYREFVAYRRQLAALYCSELSSVAEVVLPPAPDAESTRFDVFQNFEIEAAQRDRLREHLRSKGIGTLIQWGGKAVHQFEALGFRQRLPFTEELFTKLLMLPMNTAVSVEDCRYVCNAIKEFYRGVA